MTEDQFWGRPLSVKIETSITGNLIEQVTDMAGAVHRRVIDTEEAQIRAALIKLGWTPPEEPPVSP